MSNVHTVQKDISIALSLINPHIRNVLAPHIKHASEFFSDVAKKIITNILENNINDPLVLIPILEDFTDNEKAYLISLAKTFQTISTDDAISYSKLVIEHIQQRSFISLINGKLEGALKNGKLKEIFSKFDEIKKFGISSIYPRSISEYAEKLSETESSVTYRSFFVPLRNSVLYSPGELIVVAGAPANGKTMFLLNEAINFVMAGKKVLYVALGDMMPKDLLYRVLAIYLTQDKLTRNFLDEYLSDASCYYSHPICKYSITNVSQKFFEYWTDEVRKVFEDKLYLYIEEPNKIGVDDLLQFVANPSYRDIEVIFVDYDSNLKTYSDSLYDQGNEVYEGLIQVARMHGKRLVFVGSQIKPNFWNMEQVPLEALAESSRKQAVADCVITIGRNKQEVDRHSGFISITKARRGSTMKAKYFLLPSGNFISANIVGGLLYGGIYGKIYEDIQPELPDRSI